MSLRMMKKSRTLLALHMMMTHHMRVTLHLALMSLLMTKKSRTLLLHAIVRSLCEQEQMHTDEMECMISLSPSWNPNRS